MEVITKKEIVNEDEQKKIDDMRKQWSFFKKNRGKKKYEFKTDKGWLTMMQREMMLNFAFYVLGKYEEKIA